MDKSARCLGILSILQTNGSVAVVDLAERFNTSEMTIRRDLNFLSEQYNIKRTHGGAMMLDYIDKLNELDTAGVEPMSHVFPVQNVFREDVVTNGDDRDNIIQNAPGQKDGMFKVPRTVE